MKMLKSLSLALLILGATSNVVWASHNSAHFSGHHTGYHHPGGPHVHGYWGAGFYGAVWPWFYPGYYGYAVPVLPYSLYPGDAAPIEYIQMNPVPSADNTPANVWYYCENPQGYYPYVKSCAGGWKQVPAEPPK